MALPFCKLIDLTGPLDFPASVALGRVQGGDRFQVARAALIPIERLERTFFEFGDQELVPFLNPDQLRLGLNAVGDAQDLGETIINAQDATTTARFHPGGIDGPFYELTYKIL